MVRGPYCLPRTRRKTPRPGRVRLARTAKGTTSHRTARSPCGCTFVPRAPRSGSGESGCSEGMGSRTTTGRWSDAPGSVTITWLCSGRTASEALDQLCEPRDGAVGSVGRPPLAFAILFNDLDAAATGPARDAQNQIAELLAKHRR